MRGWVRPDRARADVAAIGCPRLVLDVLGAHRGAADRDERGDAVTVEDAIFKLQAFAKKHGHDVQVYFDCPECNKSFTPGIVATQAIHWKADKAKP